MEHWLQNILPTLLVVITGLITWFLKDNSEKLKLQREKLIEEKRLNYEKILEPIIQIFVKSDNSNIISKQVQSLDYKKTAFKLMMFGSDEVVNSYNVFFQYLYKNENELSEKEMLKNLGSLILSLRKDLGNNKTNLNEYDMFKCFIRDLEQYL